MNVVAHGAFRVASFLWQPRRGAFSLTVTCRAGFELTPGESPPVTLPKEAPDEERRLVEEAVLMAPRKRWPEVVVVGDAYAPDGRPVPSLAARLSVGEIDKVIRVTGDRHLTLEGALVGPAPFTRMPLRWERAAGGPDTWNPAGVAMGAGARGDGWGRVRLPNLEPAGAFVTTRRDLVPPVGLGLIPPLWPTRVAHLHRHAPAWEPATWTERPLPEDFDFAYFDVAPQDQALPGLTGHERIILDHLHPRHARLATQLRVAPPRATAGVDGASREIPLVCDTLIIDTDLGIAQLVWRGQVALDHPKQTGIVIVEAAATAAPAPGATVVLADPAPAVAPRAASVVETIAAPFVPPKAALPFHGNVGGPAAPEPAPVAPAAPVATRTDLLPQPLAPRSGSLVETIAPFRPPPMAALPFGADAVALAAPAAPVPAAPRFGAPPPEPPPAAPRFGTPPLVHPEAPVAAPAPPPPSPDEPPPAPPPMIGPLATPQMVAADASPSARALERDVQKDAVTGEISLPVGAYPIDRCARIAASIARRREETGEILEAHELAPETWTALRKHWKDAIGEEVGRGKTRLSQVYDSAFVAQIEEERGPILVEEYARLVVAADRGTVAEVLAELALPRGAMMPIERVWMGKVAGDPGAGARLRDALRAARDA